MQFIRKHPFDPLFPDEPEESVVEFAFVSSDPFGKWVLTYFRSHARESSIRCIRPILAPDGTIIKVRDRKPIGQEVIDAAAAVIGRELTFEEAEFVMQLRLRR